MHNICFKNHTKHNLFMSPLKKFSNSWKFHRKQTLDLLKAASESNLSFTPGKNLGTLAKQFRHLANTQNCYLKAINIRKVDFSKKIYGKEFDSKIKLIQILKTEDQKLMRVLKKLKADDWNEIILWGGEHNPTIFEHMLWLTDHEVMHHGQLIVYWKLLDNKFPKSWEVWGV